MKVPLLNFVGGPGVPLLNFEGGPGVPLLNFGGRGGVPDPTFKLWGGPGSRGPGSRSPGPTFTPCLTHETICKPPIKVGLSPFKKNYFTCINENPLKTMKNAYFILKTLFFFKIFIIFVLTFLVMKEKQLDYKNKANL